MKKLLLLTVLTLSISTSAQTTFGVKGGLNVSNLTGDGESADAKAGFYVGGYASIKIANQFAFQPELLYSTQGAKIGEFSVYDENYGSVRAKVKFNLDYINVPLMFKYYATEGFSIEAGPQIGFLVNSKAKVEGRFLGRKIDEKVDAKDYFKTVDFGLNVGLGYQFTNGFNVNTRYNFGLTKINEGDGKIKNSVFSVGVGYSFK